MGQIETVALWAGLVGSVVSVVLSLVAIWFAVQVERNSRAVSDQTVRSLQKIETEVERLSGDTRELIKAGWDKMLGAVHPEGIHLSEIAGAKEVAAGVVAELRSDLASLTKQVNTPDEEANIKALLKRLETTLSAHIMAEVRADGPAVSLEHAMGMIGPLSPLAKALATEIIPCHLTRKQYRALATGPIGSAVAELRESGVLVPVVGYNEEDKEIPVYYFPSTLAKTLKAVLPTMSPPHEEVRRTARNELERVGYSKER